MVLFLGIFRFSCVIALGIFHCYWFLFYFFSSNKLVLSKIGFLDCFWSEITFGSWVTGSSTAQRSFVSCSWAAFSIWPTSDSCGTSVTGFLELLKLLQASKADAVWHNEVSPSLLWWSVLWQHFERAVPLQSEGTEGGRNELVHVPWWQQHVFVPSNIGEQCAESLAQPSFKPTLFNWCGSSRGCRAVSASAGSAALGASPQVTSCHFGLKQLFS